MQTKTGGFCKNAYSFGAIKIKNRAALRPDFRFEFPPESPGNGPSGPAPASIRPACCLNRTWTPYLPGASFGRSRRIPTC